VNSMIEFKQIIGRGTRLFDGKDYFTIYDFVKAYEHFNDPEWDGEPVEPVPPRPKGGGEDPVQPPGGDDDGGGREGGEEDPPIRQRIKIKLADGKERTIQHMMATTFWSVDGRPMSAAEFITRLFGDLPALFRDEDELKALWGQPETRKALLEGLSEKGYGDDQLHEIRRMIDAEKSDLFDVLAYIAFALAPITREERVDARREQIFSRYDPKIQAFLDFVLFQYVKEGVGELDQAKLPHLLELKYRAVSDAAAELGGVAHIRDAFIGFQKHLF
jgi:type I restriction enzyme, R subunit